MISANKFPITNTLMFSYTQLVRVKLITHSPSILDVNEEFAKNISPFAEITLISNWCTNNLSIKLLDVLPEFTNAKISLSFNKSVS